MKLYESAYTYFPFVYFYSSVSTFGTIYHSQNYTIYQPFLCLALLLINTYVYFNINVKNVLHRHVWFTVILSVFGVIINNIQTEMFVNFHLASDFANIFYSMFYQLIIIFIAYRLNNDEYMLITHIIFAFIPFKRVWQVNLYCFLIFITISVIIMFSKCRSSALLNNKLHRKPLLKFFMYLRIHDYLVVLGVFQLFLDLYANYIPEIQAVDEIKKMVDEERQKYRDYEDGI